MTEWEIGASDVLAVQVTIREALQELVAWSQTAELKLVDHEENGRKTPLVTDWPDVFLELGDKQSLLTSLKESPFFKAFEDQGLMFEVCPSVFTSGSTRRSLSHPCVHAVCTRPGSYSWVIASCNWVVDC